MEAHQLRVVDEKAELDTKIEKLDAFIHGSIYSCLENSEQIRLTRQYCHMKDYSKVLGERIDTF